MEILGIMGKGNNVGTKCVVVSYTFAHVCSKVMLAVQLCNVVGHACDANKSNVTFC